MLRGLAYLKEAYVFVSEYDGAELSAWFLHVDPVEGGVVPPCPQPQRPVPGQTQVDTVGNTSHVGDGCVAGVDRAQLVHTCRTPTHTRLCPTWF